MNKFTKLIAAVALSAFAGVASAVPITGTLLFSGTIDAFDDAAGTIISTDVLNATLFKFNNPVDVDIATADFAPISGGTVIYKDLDTTPTVGAITSFWSTTIGTTTYSFDLSNIISDSKYDNPASTSRSIQGNGTLIISGLGSVDGIWGFTSQNPGALGEFSFSASTAPEPAITLLLATGLIGFGFARRARKSA